MCHLTMLKEESVNVSTYVLIVCLCYREDSAASENAEPVHYFWKYDAKSIYQSDDGNSSKSFSFGKFCSMYRIEKYVWLHFVAPLRYVA